MRTAVLLFLGAVSGSAIPESAFAQFRGPGPGPYYRGPVYGRPYYPGPYYRGGFGPYYRGYPPYGGFGFGITVYSSPWLYAGPSVRVVGAPVGPVVVAPPANGATVEPPPAGETGLKIVSITEKSSADKALMHVGDVILSVGTTRVRTLDELRSALTTLRDGETEIVFINIDSGKREKLPVKVVDGRIGINVEQVDLK